MLVAESSRDNSIIAISYSKIKYYEMNAFKSQLLEKTNRNWCIFNRFFTTDKKCVSDQRHKRKKLFNFYKV